MTLKTGVMMLKFSASITKINYIVKYVEMVKIILNCNIIS